MSKVKVKSNKFRFGGWLIDLEMKIQRVKKKGKLAEGLLQSSIRLISH